jgi:signal transduction histidine kinase
MERTRVGFDELRHDEIARTVGALFRARLRIIPWGMALFVAYAFTDATAWRRIVVLLGALGVAVLSFIELRRLKRHGVVPGMVEINVGFMMSMQALAVTVTGGLFSAFLPTVIAVVLVHTVLLSQRRSLFAVSIQLTWLAALGVIQAFDPWGLARALVFGGEPVGASTFTTVCRALFTMLVVAGVFTVSRVVRRSFEAMAQRALAARDQVLEGYADEARALTTLAGEIAHELKNPLASVKGLAALVAKDVDGRTGECVTVMRGEIDRMQGILDEFLNFSRPLVPLAQEDIDVASLCSDAAALHEGIARERGVRIRVEADGAIVARCDRRKVKQILVNLLQNAIAASPEGAEVVVVASDATHAGAPAARVIVRDRGDGIAANVFDHVFEPGVTTKATGSGLGLTVSRALARQHGGELSLRNAEGGCEGELVLPRFGAPSAEAA